MFRHRFIRLLVLSTAGYLAVLLASVLWAGVFSVRAVSAVNQAELDHFVANAGRALWGTTLAQPLSFFQPDIVVWHQALNQTELVQNCQTAVTGAIAQSFNLGLTGSPAEDPHSTPSLQACLGQTQATLDQIASQLPKTWILKHVVGWEQRQPDLATLQTGLELANWLAQDRRRVVIILQNNHELRAGGGFMGSLIQVDLNQGQITDWQLVDIYEPDGQFAGFTEAPPGVQEYLSGGRGWRLPDTNWHPDGPTAAQDVLRFLALGSRENIDLTVFLNLSVAEQALNITGAIPLPDYDTNVTASNLAEIARADRDTFFPGSYQKTQFLQHLLTQLQFQVVGLDPIKYRQLAELAIQSLNRQEIWAYATDPAAQANIAQLQADYALSTLPTAANTNQLWLHSLESNVGVNKANRHIVRELRLQPSTTQTQLQLTLVNEHPESTEDRLDYINYHRFLAPAGTKLIDLSINDQPVERWDQQALTTAAGETLEQFGFLVTVPESQKTLVSATFSNPWPFQPNQPLELVLPKQSGLPAYPVQVQWLGQSETLLLDEPIRQTVPLQ